MSELAELVIKSCTILACRPGIADQLTVLSATPAAVGRQWGRQRGRRAAGRRWESQWPYQATDNIFFIKS